MGSKVGDQTALTSGVAHFEKKHYPNIAPDCCGCCGPNWCLTLSLTLDDEEMIVTSTDCCGNRSEQKRPYAQLGNVEESSDCCGTHFVKTDGLGGPDGQGQGLAPGTACGGNKGLVAELVSELQARKIGRGNVAQVQEAAIMKKEVAFLHQKMDLILAHLQIPAPQPMVMAERLG